MSEIPVYVINGIQGLIDVMKEMGIKYTELKEEDIGIFRSIDYGLVIIKNELRRKTGIALFEEIKALNRNIGCILVCSSYSLELIRKAMSAGISNLHKEPIDREKLKSDIISTLNSIRQMKEMREKVKELREINERIRRTAMELKK
jgi:response regulator of citrate/malate metabolism